MTFRKLEGDTAVLVHGGVYKSTSLFEWDGKLFAQFSGGYVRIRQDGSTTKDGVRIEHMEIDLPLFADRFGRLTLRNGDGHTAVSVTDDGTLLIGKV